MLSSDLSRLKEIHDTKPLLDSSKAVLSCYPEIGIVKGYAVCMVYIENPIQLLLFCTSLSLDLNIYTVGISTFYKSPVASGLNEIEKVFGLFGPKIRTKLDFSCESEVGLYSA